MKMTVHCAVRLVLTVTVHCAVRWVLTVTVHCAARWVIGSGRLNWASTGARGAQPPVTAARSLPGLLRCGGGMALLTRLCGHYWRIIGYCTLLWALLAYHWLLHITVCIIGVSLATSHYCGHYWRIIGYCTLLWALLAYHWLLHVAVGIIGASLATARYWGIIGASLATARHWGHYWRIIGYNTFLWALLYYTVLSLRRNCDRCSPLSGCVVLTS